MQAEYDIDQLKLKRRGPLESLKGKSPKSAKVRVTISLDEDVLAYFKSKATLAGELPYQTQINQVLRQVIEKTEQQGCFDIKSELLSDTAFINSVVEKAIALKGSDPEISPLTSPQVYSDTDKE